MRNYKLIVTSCVMLAFMGVGVLGAQEISKNWIGANVGFLGGGVQYERVITQKITIGAEAYVFIFPCSLDSKKYRGLDENYRLNSLGVEVYGRYYPWGGIFFTQLGLGAGMNMMPRTTELVFTQGFLIEGGIGWKLDPGKKGGVFIEPRVSVPVVLGASEPAVQIAPDGGSNENNDSKFGVGVGFAARFGIGYSF
ncbi:hypothetical protein AGMMS50267_14860 [Spirochaetia bacterium]|nr:hypothetical protein AGMMS50267_14860 [Spirochaetia bacterium]